MREINQAGRDLIQSFERCELTAYPDPVTGGNPWTVGWGHTGSDVYEGQTVTQDAADSLFEQDISKAENAVNAMVTVSISDNRFAALVSFAYNAGIGALQDSFLLKCVNANNFEGAAEQFLRWDHGHADGAVVVVPGLLRRRQAEKDLFES